MWATAQQLCQKRHSHYTRSTWSASTRRRQSGFRIRFLCLLAASRSILWGVAPDRLSVSKQYSVRGIGEGPHTQGSQINCPPTSQRGRSPCALPHTVSVSLEFQCSGSGSPRTPTHGLACFLVLIPLRNGGLCEVLRMPLSLTISGVEAFRGRLTMNIELSTVKVISPMPMVRGVP